MSSCEEQYASKITFIIADLLKEGVVSITLEKK